MNQKINIDSFKFTYDGNEVESVSYGCSGVYTNKSIQLGVSTYPADADAYVSALWTSNNKNLVVDQTGKVSASGVMLGTKYTATITGFGPETVEFSVEPGYPSAAEPSVEVTLFVGYPKQDKLEQVIRHGVELGCTHFVPFFSRYCVAAPKKEEQKNERYNRIAFEAAKQCGRGVLPDVALPLPNFGALCRSLEGYDLVLFCYELGGAPLRQLLADAQPADGQRLKIALITGAEGGFAVEEAEMAANAGVKTVGLGPRILRCETAPLAVLSAVMTLTGNLE